ncbi:MAG TPA: RNA polymerase subunit sigma-70 [Ktedonobacterales bacterium]|nr:RNA polymerase subunit sigma-70 [Ktedonobacterales bacterium]
MRDDAEAALLRSAVGGSSQAFDQLFERYRRELFLYGYRLLGSVQDAEDLVQEVGVRAWMKLATFEQRASLRTWLYRIATNLGCDLIEQRRRRSLPQYELPAAHPEDPPPAANTDPIWLDPLPDTLLVDHAGEPETQYLRRESVTLAFVAVLQALPPRQRAILLLRDVLEFRSREVADLLDLSTAAVESALQRGRATLEQRYHARGGESSVVATPVDATTRTLLDKYIAAWEAANIPAIVALLSEEATLAMPPYPWWLRGRSAIAAFFAALLAGSEAGTWRLLLVGANAQPAYLSYRLAADGSYQSQSLSLLTIASQQITELTCYLDPALCQRFGFPSALVAGKAPGQRPK